MHASELTLLEIGFIVLLSFVTFPLFGGLIFFFMMALAKLMGYIDENYNKWSQEYGEWKVMYAISYLTGLIGMIFLFGLSGAS